MTLGMGRWGGSGRPSACKNFSSSFARAAAIARRRTKLTCQKGDSQQARAQEAHGRRLGNLYEWTRNARLAQIVEATGDAYARADDLLAVGRYDRQEVIAITYIQTSENEGRFRRVRGGNSIDRYRGCASCTGGT